MADEEAKRKPVPEGAEDALNAVTWVLSQDDKLSALSGIMAIASQIIAVDPNTAHIMLEGALVLLEPTNQVIREIEAGEGQGTRVH